MEMSSQINVYVIDCHEKVYYFLPRHGQALIIGSAVKLIPFQINLLRPSLKSY